MQTDNSRTILSGNNANFRSCYIKINIWKMTRQLPSTHAPVTCACQRPWHALTAGHTVCYSRNLISDCPPDDDRPMKLPRSFIAALALSASTASATSPANPAQAPSGSSTRSATHAPAIDMQGLLCLTVEPQTDITLERERIEPTSERDRLCGPWRLIPAGHALPDLSQLRPAGDIPATPAQQDAEPEQI